MSLSSSTPKFRVAIWLVGQPLTNGTQTELLCSGAGIGGLVLAITIGQFAGRNIHIDLYEAHDTITATGAGISVTHRTTDVMRELGLFETISRVATKPSSSNYGLFRTVLQPYLTRFASTGPRVRKSDVPMGGFEWFHLICKTCL